MTDTERAKSFKRTLASVRYQATHYSPIGHKLLRGALKRIGDQDGELLVGEKFKDFRAEFAADVDAQISFPMKGTRNRSATSLSWRRCSPHSP